MFSTSWNQRRVGLLAALIVMIVGCSLVTAPRAHAAGCVTAATIEWDYPQFAQAYCVRGSSYIQVVATCTRELDGRRSYTARGRVEWSDTYTGFSYVMCQPGYVATRARAVLWI